MAYTLLMGLMILMLVVVLGLFIVYPILSFVHCVRNPALSTQSKIGWGCLIFFTWTLGAAIYGIVVSGRPFYKNTGIATVVVILLATIFQTPFKNWAEKRKAGKQLNAETANEYTSQWKTYAPMYTAFGMSPVLALYQSGKCTEGKQEFDAHVNDYMQIQKDKRSNLTEENLRKLADSGFSLCQHMVQNQTAR